MYILIFINKINVNKIKINELALNYCLQKTYIDNVIIGVDSKKNLKENLDCIDFNKDYTFDEYKIILKNYNTLTKYPNIN